MPASSDSSSTIELARLATSLLDRTVLRSPWQRHIPTTKQAYFLTVPVREALFGGAAGGGKLLYGRSMLPTPRGFVPLVDLHPGDLVFGRDGALHTILAESALVTAPAYRLTFDDGAELIAHDDHRWLTFTAADLSALTHRDPAWRERRRHQRPSRAAGHKSAAFTAALTARNAASPPPTLPPPAGGVRTTAEIVATLRTATGRVNHAIPVASPLRLPARDLPLDPYVLGVWLGDGTTANGDITSADPEIVAAVEAAGFPVRRVARNSNNNRAATYTHEGLRPILSAMGLLGNKHIPVAYLWASFDQRLALLRGLMDTDGGTAAGSAEFTSTRRVLAEGVAHLARSLGHKAAVREGIARLSGRAIGPKWTVKFRASMPVFRLARKAERLLLAQRRSTRFRYIVAAQRVDPVELKCIRVSSPDHLYLAGEHLIPTHNSDALLMAALQYVDVPGYAAILFRRTFADLALPGAVMDRAKEWLAGTPARWNERDKTFTFPSGATLSFGYLDHDNDKYRYQGSELQFCGFDELSQFPEAGYRYLFSRLRRLKGSHVPLRMRAASNPGGIGHHWVLQRFLVEQRPDRLFVPATLDDNPHLDRAEYLKSLGDLDPYTRRQLLAGDWFARPPGRKFRRDWFPVVEAAPAAARRVRYWDLAATEPRPGRDPDYTCGALLAEQDGRFWLCDLRRTRGTPQAVARLVRQTAELDGRAVDIWMEQEPGSSGLAVIDDYRRRLLAGWSFHPSRSTGSKEVRANPLSSAAEAGNLLLVRGPWVADFLDEAESFPSGAHDDQIDAVSGAHAVLTTSNDVDAFLASVHPPP